MDRVNRAQAESFFKRANFNDAAECYAQTSISFEEVKTYQTMLKLTFNNFSEYQVFSL